MMLSHLERAKEEYDEEDRPDSVSACLMSLSAHCCEALRRGCRLRLMPSWQVMERMRAFHVQNLSKKDDVHPSGGGSPGATTGTFTTGTNYGGGTTKSPR